MSASLPEGFAGPNLREFHYQLLLPPSRKKKKKGGRPAIGPADDRLETGAPGYRSGSRRLASGGIAGLAEDLPDSDALDHLRLLLWDPPVALSFCLSGRLYSTGRLR